MNITVIAGKWYDYNYFYMGFVKAFVNEINGKIMYLMIKHSPFKVLLHLISI